MEAILPRVKNIYLVGIGGIGMTALAILLKERGYAVGGSDTAENANVKLLRQEGIGVDIGHCRSHITDDIDLVSYSSAVGDDNPELAYARDKGVTTLKRGALLGLLAKGKKTIAVAGSHGKTTTSSLIGYLLTSLGKQPTVCVGGMPLNYQRNAWWGEGFFVTETDESDASFLYIEPTISIITNIDYEHLDHYKTIEELRKSFLQFAKQTTQLVIGCGDDPFVGDILKVTDGLSYGFGAQNSWRADNIRYDGTFTCFDLLLEGSRREIKIPLLGAHNVLNTLSVIALFSYLGEDLDRVIELLKDFKGTKRRFQIKKRSLGVTFVDDYAHHPTEIAAVLHAARYLNPRRLFVVFQPHRFSRVQNLYREFARSFNQADEVVITDIYGASEQKIEGIDGAFMLSEIKKDFKGKATYIPKESLIGGVSSLLNEGDLVLGLGAGDINSVMERIIDEFEKARSKT